MKSGLSVLLSPEIVLYSNLLNVFYPFNCPEIVQTALALLLRLRGISCDTCVPCKSGVWVKFGVSIGQSGIMDKPGA